MAVRGPIIAIDASVGAEEHVETIAIRKGSLLPGSGLGAKYGKYVPETYCRLDGKRRFSIAVQDEGKSSRWVQDKIRVDTPLKKFFDFIQIFFKSLTWLDSFWYNINR